MKDFIKKQKLRCFLSNLELEELEIFNRIKELEYIIGMSLEEYSELNDLYSRYHEISVRIKVLKELLNIA